MAETTPVLPSWPISRGFLPFPPGACHGGTGNGGTHIPLYLTIPPPLVLPLPLLFSGYFVLLRRKTVGELFRVGGSDLVPRVPLTLTVADKVPVPPSPEVLRGVPMHWLSGPNGGK